MWIRHLNIRIRFKWFVAPGDDAHWHTLHPFYTLAMLCDPDLAIVRAETSQDHEVDGS